MQYKMIIRFYDGASLGGKREIESNVAPLVPRIGEIVVHNRINYRVVDVGYAYGTPTEILINCQMAQVNLPLSFL